MIFSLVLCLCAVSYAMAGTVKYTYDAAGRLTKADYGSGKAIEYTYDNAGNLLQRQVGSLNITISSNKNSYSAGDTLTLSVSINNLSPSSQVVDAFLGIIFPDGSAYFLDSSLAELVPARLDDTRTFTPVRTSLEIGSGYQLPATNFFSLRLTTDFPAGTYTAFAAFAKAGSVQAGSPGLLGDISLAPFAFTR